MLGFPAERFVAEPESGAGACTRGPQVGARAGAAGGRRRRPPRQLRSRVPADPQHGDVPEQEPRARGVDRVRPGRPQPAGGSPRWRRCCAGNDPDRGLVFPDAFIPAAEEMSPARADRGLGHRLARPADPQMARGGVGAARLLNVSPRRLHRPDFAGELTARLADLGIDPSWRTMQLTESATPRAGADRADPARARRQRSAAGDRRLRRSSSPHRAVGSRRAATSATRCRPPS
jgi:hypothetical protein